VFEKRLIDLGQLLQDGRIRREFFALLDKCANDPFDFAQGRLPPSWRSLDRSEGCLPLEARRVP
jgi:hypothetical protein